MRLNKRRESLRMADVDRDTPLRLAAFEHVRKLGETHDHLTVTELKPGWCFRHQLLLPRPYLVLTKPLRLDIRNSSGPVECWH